MIDAAVDLGWFDASTNAPVIYPNDLSIANLDNMVLIQVSPTGLPDGAVNSAYSAQMQAVNHGATNNFHAPYYWGLAPVRRPCRPASRSPRSPAAPG